MTHGFTLFLRRCTAESCSKSLTGDQWVCALASRPLDSSLERGMKAARFAIVSQDHVLSHFTLVGHSCFAIT